VSGVKELAEKVRLGFHDGHYSNAEEALAELVRLAEESRERRRNIDLSIGRIVGLESLLADAEAEAATYLAALREIAMLAEPGTGEGDRIMRVCRRALLTLSAELEEA
jgi:hypothetical protein